MNKTHRKDIQRAQALIDEANDILNGVSAEEQERFDGMSEAVQAGAKGQSLEGAITDLNEASENCDRASDLLGIILSEEAA